ncbi:MAG: biotin--[acetyl-CoA-carboxylase] ligase [Eubacteriales bacterium]|nr:biotin--[acetyl-CoA-carboxylase] ligase [Eubacteriales bacterium]
MAEMRFDRETISNAVHTKWAGKTVHFAEEVNSTNEWAKTLGKEGAAHGTLAVAEYQSAGKGRLGRRWTAPAGSSVMMTILLRPDFEPQYAPMLTVVMGLSVAQAAQRMGVDTSIKWPNDVVVSRKKICGILTEMSVEEGNIRYVVIGVGINVNLDTLPDELADKATSLYLETGKTYDRNEMVAYVMECFEENYERFVKSGDLALLQEDYNRMLANCGQPVRVLDPLSPYEGIARGIDQKGELVVEKTDGTVVCVSAGEVSVRGLYSYV